VLCCPKTKRTHKINSFYILCDWGAIFAMSVLLCNQNKNHTGTKAVAAKELQL